MADLPLNNYYNPELQVESYQVDPRLYDYPEEVKYAATQPTREERGDAYTPERKFDNKWNMYNTAMQTAMLALLLKDWSQTRQHQRNPEIEESNPLLGKHPSRGRINHYFSLMGLGHTAAAKALPRGLREILQAVSLGIEHDVTRRNDKAGFRVEMGF